MTFQNCSNSNLTAGLNFLARSSISGTEKLYAIQYYPHDPLPRKNFSLERVRGIELHDIRPVKDSLSLDREGVTILQLELNLSYEDYFHEDALKSVFAEQVRKQLVDHLGATRIYFHECVIRRRSPNYLDDMGEDAPIQDSLDKKGDIKHGSPLQFVHCDYTLGSVKALIRELAGGNAENLMKSRFQALNIWKPLKGPLKDWPLAWCDMQTVNPDDKLEVDAVYLSGVSEGYQLFYNPEQKWCYLSDQEENEAIVFKSADSVYPGAVPHASFFNPKSSPEEQRESIELRALVFYGDNAESQQEGSSLRS